MRVNIYSQLVTDERRKSTPAINKIPAFTEMNRGDAMDYEGGEVVKFHQAYRVRNKNCINMLYIFRPVLSGT